MQKENNNVDYSFFRFPRALIEGEQFRHISIEARTLLALILDRHGLSEINNERFTDEDGKVYVIFTLEQICEKFSCSNTRTVRILKELENNFMITRKRKNRLSPYRIYLTETFYEFIKYEPAGSQIKNLRVNDLKGHEFTDCESNKNKYNKNNFNKNNSSIIGFEKTEDEIREQIEYDCIVSDSNRKLVDEIVMIMSDVMNGTSKTVKIGRDEMPRGVVIARFCKINSEHITSILWQLSRNTYKIRNIKLYLIMMLYNAPATAESEAVTDFAFNNAFS